MDRIEFIFEETNEKVIFCIIANMQMNEVAYLLVVDEKEIDDDNPTAYVIKAVEIDGEDVIYELVDDEDELDLVSPRFEELLEKSDYMME
ncbi:MAG: DUF1292 domain-containing protein [Vallitaleaceae bacterium]|nr:DUF1292 domain-containing protein [Vallitaleaceae bacterium]